FLAGPGLVIPFLLSITDVLINSFADLVSATEGDGSSPSEEPTAATPTPDPSPVSDGGGGSLWDSDPFLIALIVVVAVVAVVALIWAFVVGAAEGFSGISHWPSEKTPREIKREEKSKQKVAVVEAQKELDERWSEAKIAHDRAFK